MKIWKILLIAFVAFVVVVGVVVFMNSRPLSSEQAATEITKITENSLNEKQPIKSVLLYVDAPQKGFSIKEGRRRQYQHRYPFPCCQCW